MSDVVSKYSSKPVNPKYYRKIQITGHPREKAIKYLTKQEFLSGNPGLIYLDSTNKIVFSDERNKEVHMVDVV